MPLWVIIRFCCERHLQVSRSKQPSLPTLEKAPRQDATEKAYDGDVKGYALWCSALRRKPFPADPEAVVRYLRDLSIAFLDEEQTRGYRWNALRRKAYAIRARHADHTGKDDLFEDGRIPEALKSLRAEFIDQKREGFGPDITRALRPSDIDRMLAAIQAAIPSRKYGKWRALRDSTIVLMTYGACLTRAEIRGLCVPDVVRMSGGYGVVVNPGDPKKKRTVLIDEDVHPRALPTITEYIDSLEGRDVGAFFTADRPTNEEPLSVSSISELFERLGMRVSPHNLRNGRIWRMGYDGASIEETVKVSGHGQQLNALPIWKQGKDEARPR